MRRSPRCTTVTREPSDDHACAISTPAPPPRIARRGGTAVAVVASMFVHGDASARPGTGGIAAALPVAMTTAPRDDSSSPTTTTSRTGRPVTTDQRDRTLLEPGDHRRVVQVVDDLVAAGEHGGRVQLSPDRDARDPSRLRGDLTGPQKAFTTACTRRRSTRPRQAVPPRSPPRPRSRRAATITSPGAPAPIPTTSNSPTSTSRYRTSVGRLGSLPPRLPRRLPACPSARTSSPATAPEIEAAFTELRRQLKISLDFPGRRARGRGARRALTSTPREGQTALPFVTLDPLDSMDADQAFHIERDGDGYRVRYAIADVAALMSRRVADGRRGARAR